MKECHQVGLKNDDPEDIKRRKELSNIVLSNNKAICKKMESTAKGKATLA